MVEADLPDKPLFTFGSQLQPRKFASRCTAPAGSLTTSFCTPQSEIECSALAHPLPRSRACRFVGDPGHIVTSGSGLNIVAVNRDGMLLGLTEQHALCSLPLSFISRLRGS